MGTKRKQIAFDLDTNVLKQIFGANYTKAYDDIGRFLKDDFDHIQGSVYISKKPMTNMYVFHYIKDLKNQYPYLDKCVRDISLSSISISRNKNLNQLFSYDGTAGKYKTAAKVKREPKILYSSVTPKQLQKLIDSGIPFEMKRSPTDCMIRYSSEHRDKIEKILSSVKKQNRQIKR